MSAWDEPGLCFLEASGNRFAVRDELLAPAGGGYELRARELCADGVLDGLLVLAEPQRGGDVRMLVVNADGSRAEACGNGLRCIAKLAVERGHVDGERLVIETDAGTRAVEVERRDGQVVAARCSMGIPRVAEGTVRIELDGRVHEAWLVDMGNPHCVLFLDDALEAPVERWGAAVERLPLFPLRTNVEFARPGRGGVDVRVFERGVGETLSCGTGAGAVAAAATSRLGLPSPLEVRTRGGALWVEWDGVGELFLEGPVGRLQRPDVVSS